MVHKKKKKAANQPANSPKPKRVFRVSKEIMNQMMVEHGTRLLVDKLANGAYLLNSIAQLWQDEADDIHAMYGLVMPEEKHRAKLLHAAFQSYFDCWAKLTHAPGCDAKEFFADIEKYEKLLREKMGIGPSIRDTDLRQIVNGRLKEIINNSGE